MSKKIVLLVAGAAIVAGGVAAISAPGHRGGWHGHGGHGQGGMMRGQGGMGPMFGGRMIERLKQLDANGDGVISQEEALAPMEKRFARLDKDGNSIIDGSEVSVALSEGAAYRKQVMLKNFDENRDGKISKDEFQKSARERFAMRDLDGDGEITASDLPPGAKERRGHFRNRMHGEGKEAEGGGKGRWSLDRMLGRVDRRFADVDANGDGVIDAAEIDAKAKPRVDHMAKRMMRRFDANNDGTITKDEFLAKAKRRFAMRDLDDDGKITEKDLPPRMRGMGVLK